MKKRNLAPLILFCVVFLAYSLYFVKVINSTERLEPNSIAKTIKMAIENSNGTDNGTVESVVTPGNDVVNDGRLETALKQYVDYQWLNVRENPTLASTVLEKVFEGEEVMVTAYPTNSWAKITTSSGTEGFVASRYLSDEAPQPKIADVESTPTEAPAESTPEAPAAEPVAEEPVVETATTSEDPVDETPLVIYDFPVITYHHISDDTEFYPDSMVLPEINLTAQLDYLNEAGVQTYTFRDFKTRLESEQPAPANGVILTFNGGYDDAYRAAEVLKERNQTAVFFVSTDMIGTDGFLTWDQVKELRSWGMEIGSMGVTGAYLPTQTEFYIRDEIIRSKDILEQQLGEAIVSFAYSSGGYTDAIVEVVREAGYDFARSANDGSRYTSDELFTLPTLRVFFPAGRRQFQAWLTP